MRAVAKTRCLALWPSLSLDPPMEAPWHWLLCKRLRAVLTQHAVMSPAPFSVLPAPFTLADYHLQLTIEERLPLKSVIERAQDLRDAEGTGFDLPHRGAPMVSFHSNERRRTVFSSSMQLASACQCSTRSQRSTLGFFEMQNRLLVPQYFAQPGEFELFFDANEYKHELTDSFAKWVVSAFLQRSDGATACLACESTRMLDCPDPDDGLDDSEFYVHWPLHSTEWDPSYGAPPCAHYKTDRRKHAFSELELEVDHPGYLERAIIIRPAIISDLKPGSALWNERGMQARWEEAQGEAQADAGVEGDEAEAQGFDAFYVDQAALQFIFPGCTSATISNDDPHLPSDAQVLQALDHLRWV